MKPDEMTIKQRKWLKLYLEVGNASKAAYEVYNCKDKNSASTIGYENLRKLDYTCFLEEAGITENLLQQKIIEGLDATRSISAISGSKANGGTVDFVDVPDYSSRHKYLETALKLKKRLVTRTDITSDGEKIELIIKDGNAGENKESK